MVRRAVLAALVLLLSSFAVAQGGSLGNAAVPGGDILKNPDLEGVGVDQKIGTTIPTEIELTDEAGHRTNLGKLLRGRPIVLLPIFLRCTGACTVEMQGVLNALAKKADLIPGRDLDLVIVDLNPKETAELAAAKKAEYLDQYGHKETAKAWTFLTGPEDAVQKIVQPIGFKYTYDAPRDRVNHPGVVYVLTPTGRVSTLMLDGMYPAGRFAGDIHRAAKEELGEPLPDTAWLGCVHVDPVTGKRSLAIQGVVRLLAIVTVLGILATIFVQSQRKTK
jgi:protein SCO1/2